MTTEERLAALEETVTVLLGYLAQRFPDGDAFGDLAELKRLVEARNAPTRQDDSDE